MRKKAWGSQLESGRGLGASQSAAKGQGGEESFRVWPANQLPWGVDKSKASGRGQHINVSANEDRGLRGQPMSGGGGRDGALGFLVGPANQRRGGEKPANECSGGAGLLGRSQ